MPVPTRWILPEPIPLRSARAVASAHAIGHLLVAGILARRGLIGDGLVDFLRPTMGQLLDPKALRHLDAAVQVLDEAIRSGRRITIYGDYDVDGTTGAALLESYLRHKGATVDSFIPQRHEGYGLTKASIERIADERRPEILLTVDCGTSSRVEADYARTRGMEVVVTDHHRPTPGKETAGIVVNPHTKGDAYTNKSLAGVAVAYKLISAMHGQHPTAFLDLVAMGTISDVMSLQGENRVLVREGLARLAHTRRPGLAALLGTAVKAKPCEHGSGLEHCYPIAAETVAFQIGPRINAIGRMGLDPNLVVELFNTKDEARAVEIATTLNEANKDRREITNRITDDAMLRVDPDAPVIVMQLPIFKGIAGLVAGRLASEWGKPAIVVDEQGAGSARSPEGIDLLTVLQEDYRHLVTAAGHSAAMGISGVKDVEVLRATLERHAWPPRLSGRELAIDAVCHLADLDEALMSALDALEPTGQGNPSVLLALGGVSVESVKKLGADGRHAKLRLRDSSGVSRNAIWFGAGDRAPKPGDLVDVAGRPTRSEFPPGNYSIELQVSDLRPSAAPIPPTLADAA